MIHEHQRIQMVRLALSDLQICIQEKNGEIIVQVHTIIINSFFAKSQVTETRKHFPRIKQKYIPLISYHRHIKRMLIFSVEFIIFSYPRNKSLATHKTIPSAAHKAHSPACTVIHYYHRFIDWFWLHFNNIPEFAKVHLIRQKKKQER